MDWLVSGNLGLPTNLLPTQATRSKAIQIRVGTIFSTACKIWCCRLGAGHNNPILRTAIFLACFAEYRDLRNQQRHVLHRGIELASEMENWCRLNHDMDFGGHRFSAGEMFRVARTYRRKNNESYLTLDGNDDGCPWSSALVIHNVPACDVTILPEDELAVATG